jgi:hypothetical protein
MANVIAISGAKIIDADRLFIMHSYDRTAENQLPLGAGFIIDPSLCSL